MEVNNWASKCQSRFPGAVVIAVVLSRVLLTRHSVPDIHTVLINRQSQLTAPASKTSNATLRPEQEGQLRLLSLMSR